MSEEKKVETTEDSGIDFNNSNEPIESIEKTVENLKKKIQELSENAAEEVKEAVTSTAEAVKDFKEDAAEKVDENISSAKEMKENLEDAIEEKAEDIKEAFEEKADEAEEAVEDVKEAVEEKSEEIAEAADEAEEEDSFVIPDFVSNEKPGKFDELKDNALKTAGAALETAKAAADKALSNPTIQNGVSAVRDNVGKALESARVQAAKLTDNEEVKKLADQATGTFKKVSDAVAEGSKAAAKKIDETMNKPEVQDALAKAKTAAAGAFEAAKNGILSLFNKKEEAEEDAEEIVAEQAEEETVQDLTDSEE